MEGSEKDAPSSPVEASESRQNSKDSLQFERRKSTASIMRRKSSVATPHALRRASSVFRHTSIVLDGIQVQDELHREMMDLKKMEDTMKSKWTTADETRNENFQLNMEKKLREAMERKKNQNLVEEMRAVRDQKKAMCVQVNLEEKKAAVDEFKNRRVTLVMQAKKEEFQKELNKRKWIEVQRAIKNRKSETMRALEEERRRTFSMTMEKQNEIREKIEKRAMEQRKSQVDWERRISCFKIQKKKDKKRYKKRLRPPTESENRFKQLQREAKMRALREEQRKRQLEHERLLEKRKRYFQELGRRAEARARLEYLRKCQELNDFRQSVAMDRMRKEYEAKVAVQKAEKHFSETMVNMLKENDKYLKRLRLKAIKEKKKKAQELKVEKEVGRRETVAENVKVHQERVAHLAEVKGRLMAEEEVKFLRAKEEQKLFNKWVSEQYQKAAKVIRQGRRRDEILRKQEVKRQAQLKKEAERERRVQTLKMIDYLEENKPEPLNETLDLEEGEAIRRQVILMQRQFHLQLLEEAARKKMGEGDEVRQQLVKDREVYLEDRDADLKEKKKSKARVVRKAQKKVWR